MAEINNNIIIPSRTIRLTDNFSVIIDEEDYKFISYLNWWVRKCPHTNYAFCNVRNQDMEWTTHSMHRLIMGSPKGLIVDHINHNGLDNRKINLRMCTIAENSRNSRGKFNKKYPYKGIRPSHRSKRWEAKIVFNRKEIYLGSFGTAEMAANAYNLKAIELFGEYAYLNVIDEE